MRVVAGCAVASSPLPSSSSSPWRDPGGQPGVGKAMGLPQRCPGTLRGTFPPGYHRGWPTPTYGPMNYAAGVIRWFCCLNGITPGVPTEDSLRNRITKVIFMQRWKYLKAKDNWGWGEITSSCIWRGKVKCKGWWLSVRAFLSLALCRGGRGCFSINSKENKYFSLLSSRAVKYRCLCVVGKHVWNYIWIFRDSLYLHSHRMPFV